jgi:hypothetical protein
VVTQAIEEMAGIQLSQRSGRYAKSQEEGEAEEESESEGQEESEGQSEAQSSQKESEEIARHLDIVSRECSWAGTAQVVPALILALTSVAPRS